MDSKRAERMLKKWKTPKTVNEVIEALFTEDVKKGRALERGWKYYVHLNKIPAVLDREGLLDHVDEKLGPTGRMEKVWVRAQ